MSRKINMLSLQKLANNNISSNSKKIDSPLAKYDNLGRLWCKICNYHVKIETLWNSHTTSNTHKKMVEDLKNVFTKQAKLQKDKINSDTPKKSILKRKVDESKVLIAKKSKESNYKELPSSLSSVKDCPSLPSNFFEKNIQNETQAQCSEISQNIDSNKSNSESSSALLPKGFFDDPELDAKIRGEKLPQEIFEDEWKLFQKIVIKDETKKSDEYREFEDIRNTAFNEISEIDEQIQKWSQVEYLHLKKTELNTNANAAIDDIADQPAAITDITNLLASNDITFDFPLTYVPRKNMLAPIDIRDDDTNTNQYHNESTDLENIEDKLWRSKGIL